MTAIAGAVAPSLTEASGCIESEAMLWRRWREAGDRAARDALVEHFLPYARILAAVSFKGRFHDEVEFADYFQLASLGLLDAVERYDPGQGVQFKTYASHRIRGAILNGLEKLTEKSQQIALQKRLRKERREAIAAGAAQAMGHEGPPESLSARHPSQDLLAYLADVGIGIALSVMLEDTGMIGCESPEDAPVEASPEVLYFQKREDRYWRKLLRELTDRLPAQERHVIRCHYLQSIAFEEIARMLGVSRSRISQLHRSALASLRRGMGHGPSCEVAW
ncbi:sigma-70 family RNA polymerase sigma factor [Acidovorax sp. NCPPB 2350]|nr:sigma-70 family RNA polymerase sigma factor [Acidovorax sp. NCPPB 2350]